MSRLTMSNHRRCACSPDTAALWDLERWLSVHQTSQGSVVFYRCYCGRAMVGLVSQH